MKLEPIQVSTKKEQGQGTVYQASFAHIFQVLVGGAQPVSVVFSPCFSFDAVVPASWDLTVSTHIVAGGETSR